MPVSENTLNLCHRASCDDLVANLCSGRTTGVAFITCSELGCRISGIPQHPELPVYVWQNLGGCVDETLLLGSESVSDIIVYGHYPCSLVELCIKPNDRIDCDLSYLSSRMQVVSEKVQSRFGDKRDDSVMRAATEMHVLRQLQLASEQPEVAKALKDKQIRLGAWMLFPESKRPVSFDARRRMFTSI